MSAVLIIFGMAAGYLINQRLKLQGAVKGQQSSALRQEPSNDATTGGYVDADHERSLLLQKAQQAYQSPDDLINVRDMSISDTQSLQHAKAQFTKAVSTYEHKAAVVPIRGEYLDFSADRGF